MYLPTSFFSKLFQEEGGSRKNASQKEEEEGELFWFLGIFETELQKELFKISRLRHLQKSGGPQPYFPIVAPCK